MELNIEPLLGQRAAEDRARLLAQIRQSPSVSAVLSYLSQQVPDLANIPQATYTLYRQFEHTGFRRGYEKIHFARRSMLTRAVLEFIMGDDSRRDIIHDLLWSICEETSWVLPAHEEQGPDFWELKPSPRASHCASHCASQSPRSSEGPYFGESPRTFALRIPILGTEGPYFGECPRTPGGPDFGDRQRPLGAHTALNREPDAIDLFCAETGASVAEAIYLIGDQLAPEVVQRVRQEVERRIFKPYLAYGRKHWWYKGALNWNGVCNGSIGLAFMRLERDTRTLNEAISQVLEGLEAYLATGFEADGGSIEGIGYWNYGLMYYVTLAELLREQTGGQVDLLANPRMKDVARYPLAVALASGIYVNFGDAVEQTALSLGVVQRIAERTGVNELRGLLLDPSKLEGFGGSTAKLAIIVRDAAWWDGQIPPYPATVHSDHYLPQSGLVKFSGQTQAGKPVLLTAKAGHTDGHHSHTDIGTFIYNLNGESLLCDPGRGMYSKEYFRQSRYQNIFCNSIGHNVPRIAGALQTPGPEFGGRKQFRGQILDVQTESPTKTVLIDFKGAYDLPALAKAERHLALDSHTGCVTLTDQFQLNGSVFEVEEAFVTWNKVEVNGSFASITGTKGAANLSIVEPVGVAFELQSLAKECRANQREGVLTRLIVQLPSGATSFKMTIAPR